MRAMKHIAGILLTTVGVFFLLGTFVLVFHPDPQVPLWNVGIMFLFLVLLPLWGAHALLWVKVTAPDKSCPQCGSTERQAAGLLRTSRNPWFFLLGGWLFAALWGASREQQVRCVNCDKIYWTDTRGTRITGVLLWVFLLFWLVVALVQVFLK